MRYALMEQSQGPTRFRRKRSRRRQVDPLDRIALALLAALVGVSVLPLGGVLFWALWVIAWVALCCGVVGLAALRRVPKSAWFLLALAIFCVLQALPLPLHWVELLSPAAAQVWVRAHFPFDSAAPSRATLSIDPGASLTEALKLTTYASTVLLAARVRGRYGSGAIASLIFVASTAVALITLLHGVFGAQMLFGVYEPTFHVPRWSLGPLLNSNNFAGYALLGIFAGVALLVVERKQLPQSSVIAGLGTLLLALALSSSRAGVVATLAGLGVFVAVGTRLCWLPRGPLRWGVLVAFVGGVLALLVGPASHADVSKTADMSRKLATWRWSLNLLRDHPWFGVGRGAFETALPPYRQPLPNDWSATFTHAENFIVQWLADWGVVVGGAAVCTFLVFFARSWWLARATPHRFALLTGLAALLVQNMADLGLEIPALAILAILALVEGGPTVHLLAPAERKLAPKRLLLWAAPGALALVLATLWGRYPVGEERASLATRYRTLQVGNRVARANFREALVAAMSRHPGESYFPLLGSLVAHRARDDNPVPWAARALERSPLSGPVHVALAEILARRGATAQAMLHLRMASEFDSSLLSKAGQHAAALAPSIDTLLEAIPAGPRGDSMMLAACSVVASQLRFECWEQAAKRAPDDISVLKHKIETSLTALVDQTDDCADELSADCQQDLEASIEHLARLAPDDWEPAYFKARLLASEQRYAEAAKLLAHTCPPGSPGQQCARDFVLTSIAAGSDELRVQAVDAYSARECAAPNTCATANDWLAVELLRSGSEQLAFACAARAAESQPDAARWLSLADLALKLRRYGDARRAVAHSQVAADATLETKARGERLEARILRETLLR